MLSEKYNFKALILAGGYATRLYPITLDVSKPLLRINSKTIIDFCIKELGKISNLKDISVITNDKFYNDYCIWRKKLRIKKKVKVINDKTKTEEQRLGAVGDIYYAIKKEEIKGDLLVIGGDNIFEKGLADFIKFAQKNSPSISIGIYDVKNKDEAKRYGVVEVNKKNQILQFQEKPTHPKSCHVAMCMYYFPKSTLGLLREYLIKSKLDADKAGNYIRWLMTKIKVFGFKFRGLWVDIGQLDTYLQAQVHFLNKK